MKNDFNKVAWVYDWLARHMFNHSILNAQCYHLSSIRPSDNVLVLGGGSGQFLNQMPLVKEMHYVEKSAKMIALAKRRKLNFPVEFVHQDFLEVELHTAYDVVICPFFLDCFNSKNLPLVIQKIRHLLNTDGRMIITDFLPVRHSFLYPLMHLFFKIVASLEANKLLDIRKEVSFHGFKEDSLEIFDCNIFSAIYKLS